MRGMILAAGLGTRLRPLTKVRPKALVPLMGATILDYWMRRLELSGADAAVVNAFHLGEALASYISARAWAIELQCRVEPVLLGTGGGLRNAADFFGPDPAVIVNGDTVCDAPLDRLMAEHVRQGGPVSLLVHDCEPFNNVAVDDGDRILGFGPEALELSRIRSDVRLLAFTGIHFIDPRILYGLPANRPSDILDLYRRLIEEGRFVHALYHPGMFWREMGSVDAYVGLVRELAELGEGLLSPLHTGSRVRIHPGARIAANVTLKGVVTAGDACTIENGAVLENVILWDGVHVGIGARLRECIVTDGVTVNGNHEDEIIVD